MNYSSDDYYYKYGGGGFFFTLADIYAFAKKKTKKIYPKLLDVDYYHYITKTLQLLPEALIIVFLGFLAVYGLFKYSEGLYGNRIYPIVTNSMRPEIIPGSLVYTNPSSAYFKGDIISYVEKTEYGVDTGKILTHRIIDKTGEGKFIAKGDANPDADPVAVNASQIQGKVLMVLPYLGYLEVMLKTIPGFLILVVAPCVYIIVGRIKEVKQFSRGL